MQKYLHIALLLSGTIAITMAFKNQPNYTAVTAIKHDVIASPAENYATYCSGCHGEKMDAFTDRNWKHGNKLADLMKAIKNGYPDEGMPAFARTFSDKEIKELSEYILKGIKNVETYNFNDAPVSNIFKSDKLTVKLDTIVTGIEVPWGMAFLPDGAMLITNRNGELYRVKDKKKELIAGVPEVLAEGQGGLFEVILHPEFSKNSLIYFTYSKPKKVDGKLLATTAVMRAGLNGNTLTEQSVIFEALPYAPTRHHYGGKMVFDKGYLYVSVGERGNEKQKP